MAGHSQFKNIMHRKGAQDARRGRQFARIIREITVSARQGLPEPASNPRLRAAVAAAREANMPKDTVERAIKKAAGTTGGEDYAEVRYEGYGPAGVAIIVEALTDNRNRTAGEVRAAFSKHGGALGESNSVSFLFNRAGRDTLPGVRGERGSHAGGGDRGRRGRRAERRGRARGAHLAGRFLRRARRAGGSLRPACRGKARLAANHDGRARRRTRPNVLKLVDALEDSDDVQNVYANFDLPEAVLARLSA